MAFAPNWHDTMGEGTLDQKIAEMRPEARRGDRMKKANSKSTAFIALHGGTTEKRHDAIEISLDEAGNILGIRMFCHIASFTTAADPIRLDVNPAFLPPMDCPALTKEFLAMGPVKIIEMLRDVW